MAQTYPTAVACERWLLLGTFPFQVKAQRACLCLLLVHNYNVKESRTVAESF